jgi:hypothetical protein
MGAGQKKVMMLGLVKQSKQVARRVGGDEPDSRATAELAPASKFGNPARPAFVRRECLPELPWQPAAVLLAEAGSATAAAAAAAAPE